MQIVFSVIAVLFLLAGIALVIIAIFTKQKSRHFFDSALPAEGTVIALGISQPRPFKKIRYSEPTYTSVMVEFTTRSGEVFQTEIENNLMLSYSGQYKIGDKINLLYNPVNPKEIVVTTRQSISAARIIMITIGIFLLFTGISMLLLKSFFEK